MQQKNSWILPEGIEEILPEDAKHLESLRSKLLEMFACWGYDFVIPPLIDFLDSLYIRINLMHLYFISKYSRFST